MTTSVLEGHSPIGRFVCGASRGPSACAELLVYSSGHSKLLPLTFSKITNRT